jgi:glutamyl-tRNA reductase
MAARELTLIGASHRTAPLDMLGSLALAPDEIARLLPAVREEAGLDEALILGTCNRTEIYGLTADPAAANERLERWLIRLAEPRAEVAPGHLYARSGDDATRHLYRVICGLDSLILGETEIVGQAQRALDLAREAGTAGGFLGQLFAAAFHAGKRSRTETGIGAGTTSVASAAVHLARRVFGDLGRREVLVLGAGETGVLAARHFRQHAPRTLYIANRTPERAAELAREVDGRAIPIDEWVSLLRSVDTVVCATHAKEPLITAPMVREAVRHRGSRMLLLIDLAVTRNIDSAVAGIDNVYRHDLYDMQAIVEQSLARRAREIPAVEAIVDRELAEFIGRRATLEAGPVIRELRERFEELRRQELARFAARFDERYRPVAERLTGDLVNKLLHWPTLELRALAREPDCGGERVAWARRLFGLDRPLTHEERE